MTVFRQIAAGLAVVMTLGGSVIAQSPSGTPTAAPKKDQAQAPAQAQASGQKPPHAHTHASRQAAGDVQGERRRLGLEDRAAARGRAGDDVGDRPEGRWRWRRRPTTRICSGAYLA